MLRRLPALIRPLGLALGVFIALNVALALQRPELPVTRVWLHAELPEPALSLFAGVLGAALLVPAAMAAGTTARWVLGGVFLAFWILSAASTAAYYDAWFRGRIATDLPLPLSAVVFVVLLSELARVTWGKPAAPVTPPPARLFVNGLAVAGAFLAITVAHVVTFGRADHRRPADAAVILGTKVYADGTPCQALADRLDTGIDLYRQGLVRYLIMTGAVDAAGTSEPLAMRAYAGQRGVPLSRIILDESGANTRGSALGVQRIRERMGLGTLLAVTQYFHCARVKLAFEREGVPCLTVPTCSSRADGGPTPGRLSREGFFLFREAIAFPFYLIYHR
ncbi:MAG: YdcF family protein [Planctomycetes bacterium]|nr:YdcF family protein [Planctomycetota bacterium]